MEAAAVAKESRKKPHCSFCKNHGIKEKTTQHICKYKANCTCKLCILVKKGHVVMQHQQRLWRFNNLKMENVDEGGGKYQKCDNCRNHAINVRKSNHECPFQDCKCELCQLTAKRREILKHIQRVRRQGVVMEEEIVSDGSSRGENTEGGEDNVKESESKRHREHPRYQKNLCRGSSSASSSRHIPVPVSSRSILNNEITPRQTYREISSYSPKENHFPLELVAPKDSLAISPPPPPPPPHGYHIPMYRRYESIPDYRLSQGHLENPFRETEYHPYLIQYPVPRQPAIIRPRPSYMSRNPYEYPPPPSHISLLSMIRHGIHRHHPIPAYNTLHMTTALAHQFPFTCVINPSLQHSC